eukprot:g11456.t1
MAHDGKHRIYFRRDTISIFAGEDLESFAHALSRRALIALSIGSKVSRETRPPFVTLAVRAGRYIGGQGGGSTTTCGLVLTVVELNAAVVLFATKKAILCRHEDAARLLLSKGADVNVLDRHRNSALHNAGEFGSPQLLGELLDPGAKRGIKHIRGHTPLHDAFLHNKSEIVSMLVSGEDDREAIVNATNIVGNSALVPAIACGHEGMVAALLNAGADTKALYIHDHVKYPLLYLARNNLWLTELLI